MPVATITAFLDVINNATNGNYHDQKFLVDTYFVQDSGAGAGALPMVAVTEHNTTTGPAFLGTKKIKKMFSRLFTAFPDVTLTPLIPATPLYLTSQDTNTIAVQCTLTGTHSDWWFPKADSDKFYSKPLSDITPAGVQIAIPAIPVFTFVGASISQLAIYMDRYHFIKQLAPQALLTVNADVQQLSGEFLNSTKPASLKR
jgi:hypothetical protein